MKYARRIGWGVSDVLTVIGRGVMVVGEWSLLMFVGDSKGPSIIKERRGKQRREEETNCRLRRWH